MAGKRLMVGVLAGLLGAVLSLGVWGMHGWDSWEAKTYDWRARELASTRPPNDRVVLIFVDQNSLDWAKDVNSIGWPWPRQLYGAIADFCRRGGAASIGFDILFTEPSFYGSDDDDQFAAALAAHPGSVTAAFLATGSGQAKSWPIDAPPSKLQIAGLEQWLTKTKAEKITYPRAALPIAKYTKNSAHLANVQISPDPDGVFRRLPLFSIFAGQQLPILGFGVRFASDPSISCRIDQNGLQVGKITAPIDEEGQVLLRYRGPSGTHRAYSAAAVLQSELRLRNDETAGPIDPEEFRDKIVLVGFSAPGLMDLRTSPIAAVYPGVEIHATLADNLLSGDFIRLPGTSAVVLTVLAFALLCGLAMAVAGSWWTISLLSAGLSALPVLFGFAAYYNGYWLPIVALEAALIISVVAALTGRYALEGRQKRFIKSAFAQYLSPVFIEELIRNPEKLKLGGERRIISIFFSDLQGFTGLSEKLDPEDLTAFLNHYLTAMTEIIHQEGGTVDKYEGDAIIAFWNAPLDLEDHAERAVRAGLRCLDKLEEMQPELRQWVEGEVKMRVGINTGPAVVGNMGSHDRFDYTMLGDSVNLAARLEGVNKQFGTWILVSEDTRRQMGGKILVREVARVTVVGRAEPVAIYEPLSAHRHAKHQKDFQSFAQGLELFRQGDFPGAATIFATTTDRDPAALAYETRSREFAANPPQNWDGVWRVTEKG